MPGRPVIKLLATGGTIATTSDRASGRSAPTLSGAALSDLLADLADTIDLVPEELSSAPSWTLDPQQMADVARRARDAARDPSVRGVVVTHGTTTLEYTAFLADLFLDVATPVVLTGAMRKADHREPDGPRNLRDAVRVAASGQARGKGALVVFAGRVMAGGRAWKARRVDLDAFVDLDGDLGRVTDAGVAFASATARGDAARHRRIGPFAGDLDPHVALVKAVPGMDGWPLESLPESVRGLVLEALPGVGGIPPAMTGALLDVASRMPVVIASRAPYGELPQTPTGGTGEPLRDAALLSAKWLSAEQAWLLLMVVLAETTSSAESRARFVEATG